LEYIEFKRGRLPPRGLSVADFFDDYSYDDNIDGDYVDF